jgi:hypothetical protein
VSEGGKFLAAGSNTGKVLSFKGAVFRRRMQVWAGVEVQAEKLKTVSLKT